MRKAETELRDGGRDRRPDCQYIANVEALVGAEWRTPTSRLTISDDDRTTLPRA
jgi:hypothetical protein